MTPVLVRPLLFDSCFDKGPILFVSLAELFARGTVFVVIRMVVVLMVAVEHPVVVSIVAMVACLTSMVFRPRGIHCRGHGEACHQNERAQKYIHEHDA